MRSFQGVKEPPNRQNAEINRDAEKKPSPWGEGGKNSVSKVFAFSDIQKTSFLTGCKDRTENSMRSFADYRFSEINKNLWIFQKNLYFYTLVHRLSTEETCNQTVSN